MKTLLRILYLEDSSAEENEENCILEKEYNIRKIFFPQEIKNALKAFSPHVVLWDNNARVSPQEVLPTLKISEENILSILPVRNGNLKEVLPLLESLSIQLNSRETSKLEKKPCCELEERYRSIYQTSLDGILVTEPNGTILAANPAACRMLEMTEEEICRAGRSGIVDPEDHRLAYAVSQREKLGKAHTELTFVKKSGVKFPVELTSSVYKDREGNSKTTAIIRDITERKKIEEQLNISHETYRNLFYKSPIPYWIYDRDSLQIVDVNDVALKAYGYSRAEFLDLTIMDLREKEDIPDLQKDLEMISRSTGIVGPGKFNHKKKDGTPLKVEIVGYKVDYENHNCRLVACLDVTEKENFLTRLKEKEARLTAAQEIAKIGYWEWDKSTDTFFLSEMMYQLWGVEKSTFNPSWESIINVIHPEDRNSFQNAQDDLIHEGKENSLEYRVLSPSGEIKWIQEKGRIVSWQGNQPEKVEKTARDITDEKNFIEKLSTSESRYKGIVKSQTNYIIRTDMEGNYTYCNEKFFKDFGWLYSDEEIIGKPSLSSIMEYHHQAVIELVERCILAPGTAFQIEIDKPKKKGGIRTTLWDFVCLLDAKGNPSEIQCAGVDISARVKAEKDLKESRLRYKLITEATSDAIWDWNIESASLFWGNSYKSIFGYDPGEHQTLASWEQLLHPDDRARVTGSLDAAIEGTERKWEANYRFKKKNGDYAYVLDKGIILRDQKGKAYRAVGSIQDITEKKKLEDLLEKANNLSRIGSFDFDLVSNELYWSAMTREIHEVGEDYKPHIDSGIDFYKEGKNRDRIKNAVSRAINENEAFDEELQIVTAKGRELWVRVIGEPVTEYGKCIRISGSFQDIDKIKRAELEVLNAAREKETLLESIGDAFFALAEDWTVTYWNNQAARLLDCPRETILKRNLWEIFPDAVGTAFQKNYEATLKDRQRRHFEAYFEGTAAWYEVNVYPSSEGLSVFFKDITRRKTADVKLRELNKSLKAHTRELVTANKGLEQFSYIVSHNLRSPVANILGLADLLQNSEYPQGVKEKLFGEIFSNVERLDSVITDLNGILQAKVDVKTQKERIDLKLLINEIKSSIKNVIKEEKAEIKCSFGDIHEIVSVKSYLYSIFYNLIINSIKYRKPDVAPVIEISARRKADFIIIAFKDNGLGIDLANKQEQLFTLYKRFHHHIEGKGMGLFMVKTQVQMLGGRITVDSRVNEGTTFTIILKESLIQLEEENETALSISGN
ncbi:hypothetical protein C7S20_07400 [Christiangramia fulva]|uniref:histidine kinase n=1 Tax=Christiangramia fulva TaxID=2126553 RepID=A0A2R3Z4C3_9FLAO|nr:PAS domain S-box protein [Christiangramia fulva]AVR45109.1 hypothetical protein C7S20_07400 [Christiangramia fulva]